jgi:hypothetical protein
VKIKPSETMRRGQNSETISQTLWGREDSDIWELTVVGIREGTFLNDEWQIEEVTLLIVIGHSKSMAVNRLHSKSQGTRSKLVDFSQNY